MSLGKVYLASGWFNPEWLQEVENIKSVFEKHGIQHDDFDIDGLVIARKDVMQTKVLAEDEVAKKMHNDIENYLQDIKTEEE